MKLQKGFKKIIAVVLAAVMLFSVASEVNKPVIAAETENLEQTASTNSYGVLNDSGMDITVNIQHYSDVSKQEIYSSDEFALEAGQSVANIDKLANWDVKKIVKLNGDSEEEVSVDAGLISVNGDVTLRVYYDAKVSVSEGNVTFFDYNAKPQERRNGSWENAPALSINTPSNYPANSSANNRFSVGKAGEQTFAEHTYNAKNAAREEINKYTASSNGVDKAIKEGIISGLTSDYTNVVFNFDEPGVFSRDEKVGKRIIDGYKLVFSQIGDTYSLSKVVNSEGTKVADAGSNFFPLNGDRPNGINDAANDGGNNDFFGMRYDVDFVVGDYTGALNFSFVGDDDLWVVLDGTQVVIDLGGVHGQLPASVDLANYVKDVDKNMVHRLTVLYMERGGYQSNCTMNFTLPSATITAPGVTPTASLELTKVGEDNNALAGASFTLSSVERPSEVSTLVSDEDGIVSLSGLKYGTYTLKENVAPTGYKVAVDPWKVVVDFDEDENLQAKLYTSNDELVENNQLVNELLPPPSIGRDKTTTLVDWQERTYDIDLTAWSKIIETESTTYTAPVDVILVLDQSGSMADKSNIVTYERYGTYGEKRNKKDLKNKYNNDTLYMLVNDEYVCVSDYYYLDSKKLYADYEDHFFWYEFVDEMPSSTVLYVKKTTTSKETKLQSLKKAAKAFVAQVAENTDGSKVGVTVFDAAHNSAAGYEQKIALTDVDSNLSRINNAIDGIVAEGGTEPHLGLNNALAQLTTDSIKNDGNKKYVILFTDGEPTGYSDKWNSNAEASALSSAANLKATNQGNATIYTIGLGIGSNKKAVDFLNKIASPGCANTVESANALNDIFKQISNEITNTSAITGAVVRDYIANEFVVMNDDVEITVSMARDGVRLDNGATVKYDEEEGQVYVEWTNQVLPYSEDGSDAWNKTIRVKAKESYVGGNAVQTNGRKSAIYVEGEKPVIFPQPEVNVHIDFNPGEVTDTIFKGTVIGDEFSEDDLETVTGTSELDLDDVTILYKWSDDMDYTDSLDGYVQFVKAQKVYSPTSYPVTIQVTPKVADDSEAAAQAAEAMKNDDNVDYTATMTGEETEAPVEAVVEEENETSAESSETKAVTKTGYYHVLIEEGTIQISKTIGEADYDKLQGDPTFTFKVVEIGENEVPKATYYKTVRFTEDVAKTAVDGKLTLSASITGLEAGTYVVTELRTLRFATEAVAVAEETNCVSSVVAKTSATFEIGHAKDNLSSEDTRYPGSFGKVTFTNAKDKKNKLSSTDTVKNSIVIGQPMSSSTTVDNGTSQTY